MTNAELEVWLESKYGLLEDILSGKVTIIATVEISYTEEYATRNHPQLYYSLVPSPLPAFQCCKRVATLKRAGIALRTRL